MYCSLAALKASSLSRSKFSFALFALLLDFGPRHFKVGFDEAALKPWCATTPAAKTARRKHLPKLISSEDQRVWGGLDAISACELIRDMEALTADS